MGREGFGITRRTVLTGFGASVVDTAFAESNLDIQAIPGGGFVVFTNFHEAWRVDGDSIRKGYLIGEKAKPPVHCMADGFAVCTASNKCS